MKAPVQTVATRRQRGAVAAIHAISGGVGAGRAWPGRLRAAPGCRCLLGAGQGAGAEDDPAPRRHRPRPRPTPDGRCSRPSRRRPATRVAPANTSKGPTASSDWTPGKATHDHVALPHGASLRHRSVGVNDTIPTNSAIERLAIAHPPDLAPASYPEGLGIDGVPRLARRVWEAGGKPWPSGSSNGPPAEWDRPRWRASSPIPNWSWWGAGSTARTRPAVTWVSCAGSAPSGWWPPMTSTRSWRSMPSASSMRRSWPTRRWWPDCWPRARTW